MGEGQVIQGIIGGFLAIGGILLALISSGILGRRLSKGMECVAIGLALSGVGLFILLTSFPEYAIGFSVLATLALAIAAFLTIKAADAREERRRQEELLKDVIKWSADVLKHCSSVAAGFNNEIERSQARDKYLTLKFAVENLIISVENDTSFIDLLTHLRCANNCFDGPSYNSLQDDKEKRTNLEKFCKNVRTEAFKLLRK